MARLHMTVAVGGTLNIKQTHSNNCFIISGSDFSDCAVLTNRYVSSLKMSPDYVTRFVASHSFS